ncbi:MAG TPA: zinc-ribbon domain-containing protein [Polyangiaceae bacterium]|nr:zinc-ribbon domain-containing protein [Polyangiaceae bacterium]
MRVTCESCGANYNLPDAKVRGRKAKVRCKRCSGTIVVDGTALDPSSPSIDDGGDDEEATQIMNSPLSVAGSTGSGQGPDVWTVNLTDDDQQPMTTQQIVEGWVSGKVTDDAFVWRDGMSDWQPVREVGELADAIAAAESSRKPATPRAPAVQAQALGQIGVVQRPASEVRKGNASASRPAGLGAGAMGAGAMGVGAMGGAASTLGGAAAAKPRPATFDLFGPPRSLERDSHPHASPVGGPPAQSSENSVVFSLEALKAAAGKTESRAAESRASEDLLTLGGMDSMGSPMSAPLIEVIPTRPPPAAPVMGVAAQPAFAPVAAPAAKKTPAWIWAVLGLVILGGGFFGGRMLTGSGSEGAAAATAARAGTADTASVEAQKAEDEKKAAEAKKAEEDKKAEDAKKAEEDKKAEEEKNAALGKTPGTPAVGGGSGASKPADKGGEKPPEKTGGGGGGGGGRAFDVGAAKSALSSAASQVASCKSGDGPTGSGKVQVTFAPSGRVTSANVTAGPFGGTSVGGCVARTFRAAKVPSFDGDPVTVSKSFSIN